MAWANLRTAAEDPGSRAGTERGKTCQAWRGSARGLALRRAACAARVGMGMGWWNKGVRFATAGVGFLFQTLGEGFRNRFSMFKDGDCWLVTYISWKRRKSIWAAWYSKTLLEEDTMGCPPRNAQGFSLLGLAAPRLIRPLVTSLHISPTCSFILPWKSLKALRFAASSHGQSNDPAGKQLNWSPWFRSQAITRFDRTPRQPYVLFSSAAQWMS